MSYHARFLSLWTCGTLNQTRYCLICGFTIYQIVKILSPFCFMIRPDTNFSRACTVKESMDHCITYFVWKFSNTKRRQNHIFCLFTSYPTNGHDSWPVEFLTPYYSLKKVRLPYFLLKSIYVLCKNVREYRKLHMLFQKIVHISSSHFRLLQTISHATHRKCNHVLQ